MQFLNLYLEPTTFVNAVFQGESDSQDYRVLSAGQDNTVRIWDPFEMVCLRVLQETRSELTALAFFAAGNSPITGKATLLVMHIRTLLGSGIMMSGGGRVRHQDGGV